LKEKPFTGVGSAAYLSAFTKYRPLGANSGDLWNQRFLQASNEILQTFTTNGLIGLLVLLYLLYQLYRLAQTVPQGLTFADAKVRPLNTSGLAISLLAVAASLLLLPLSVVSLSVLVTLMTSLVISQKALSPQPIANSQSPAIYDATIGLVALREKLPAVFTTVLPWALMVLAVILSGGTLFLTSRAWAAEIAYRRALVAIIQNDGTEAYNKMIQTIQWNPFIDTYHRQYADINLRLANSLAARQNLSDQDRANVSQLVQQSIREGKIAVQLDPEDVQNWEILARTYRALINVAQGAGDWTLVAYGEAVRRDPVNPLLRLELGGVFYNLKDWESAIRNFQAAVNLKPDYANGYYNLALAYEQDGRTARAAQAMQAAVTNLRADSADFAAAQQKLTELVEKVKSTPETTSTTGTTGVGELSGPEPLPTPLPGANRVKLGEEEKPPVTPTPTPSLSPTPTVNITPTPAP
jgi:tetratricopeptide (TPR) repeat protein